MNWKVTYWDGSQLREWMFTSDPYNVWQAMLNTPAGAYTYQLLKIERLAS